MDFFTRNRNKPFYSTSTLLHVSSIYPSFIFVKLFIAIFALVQGDETSLPADVLWGSFVTHSNEPQRTSAGRLEMKHDTERRLTV